MTRGVPRMEAVHNDSRAAVLSEQLLYTVVLRER